MTILRIFIKQEDLSAVNWQIIDNNMPADSGSSSLDELMLSNPEHIEIYLAPSLATVLQIELGAISDRKINDELLLGLIEDSLAEDIEACKPILLRLNDGVAYVAVLNRHFYELLLEKLANNVKQVKFIQPFPYLVNRENDIWTVYLIGKDQFIRTSQYEYYILDDAYPIPELLDQLLQRYQHKNLIVYSEDSAQVNLIASKYNLNCKQNSELIYGVSNWNFYNEKSKRFNLKLKPSSLMSLVRLLKVSGIFFSVYLVYWLINLGFMIYDQSRLQGEVNSDLQGMVASSDYNPNLLSQVDDKIIALEHEKGLYSATDMLSLFNVFLKSMTDVDNTMLEGVMYSNNQLQIFVNGQFSPIEFANDQAILATKRIHADIMDYKTYKASLASSNKNNNGGGVLASTDTASSGSTATLQDAAWVITLQIISRMDSLNDSSAK